MGPSEGASGPASLERELPAALGELIGGYRLESVLGRGGMGCVYLATHPRLGRKAAVKVLNGDVANDPAIVARFFREARIVNEIRHPNIVDIYDFLESDSPRRVACIMEFLDGRTLAERLHDEGPLPLPVALHVADQIAAALEAVHGHQVVHRDLKPDNILLLGDDPAAPMVKVLDFGIAKVTENAADRTATGFLMGTPAYMAPEQIAQTGVGPATDVYALGEVLAEAVSGTRAFAGSNMEILRHKLAGTAPTLAVPEGPERARLERLLAGMLDTRPTERPPLTAVRIELAALLGRPPPGAPSPPPAPRADAPRPRPRTTLHTLATFVRERRGPSLAVVALAVIAVLSTTYALSRASRPAVDIVVEPLPGAPPPSPAPAPSPPVPPAPPPPPFAPVTLRSDPSGATVTDGRGRVIGRTPLRFDAPPALPLRLARKGRLDAVVERLDGLSAEVVLPRPRPREKRPPAPPVEGPLKKHALPTW